MISSYSRSVTLGQIIKDLRQYGGRLPVPAKAKFHFVGPASVHPACHDTPYGEYLRQLVHEAILISRWQFFNHFRRRLCNLDCLGQVRSGHHRGINLCYRSRPISGIRNPMLPSWFSPTVCSLSFQGWYVREVAGKKAVELQAWNFSTTGTHSSSVTPG